MTEPGDEQTFGDIYNGFTFGGGGGRRKKRKPDPPPLPPITAQPAARHPPQPTQPTLPAPPPMMSPEPEPVYAPPPVYQPHMALPPKAQEISWPETGVEPVEPAEPDAGEAPQIVRAYAWTRGRTTSQFKLEIETLLTIGDRYRSTDEWLQAEYHSIAALCQQPRSVAEVAALLSIPLGVAKVLLGDMAAQGLLVVHEVAGTDGQGPDLVLMERILSGLRRL